MHVVQMFSCFNLLGSNILDLHPAIITAKKDQVLCNVDRPNRG